MVKLSTGLAVRTFVVGNCKPSVETRTEVTGTIRNVVIVRVTPLAVAYAVIGYVPGDVLSATCIAAVVVPVRGTDLSDTLSETPGISTVPSTEGGRTGHPAEGKQTVVERGGSILSHGHRWIIHYQPVIRHTRDGASRAQIRWLAPG